MHFRNFKEIQASSERRVQQLESDHEMALRQCHHQVQILESQVEALERQLGEKNKALQRINSINY